MFLCRLTLWLSVALLAKAGAVTDDNKALIIPDHTIMACMIACHQGASKRERIHGKHGKRFVQYCSSFRAWQNKQTNIGRSVTWSSHTIRPWNRLATACGRFTLTWHHLAKANTFKCRPTCWYENLQSSAYNANPMLRTQINYTYKIANTIWWSFAC